MRNIAVIASLCAAIFTGATEAAPACSTADLHGVYSFSASGSIVANPVGLPPGPFAAAGRTTYEGNGSASGVIQVSLNGTIAPPIQPSTWTGTYSVDPTNCTTTKALTITSGPLTGVTLHFFITAGGEFTELRFIATDAYTAISGSAKKQ